jgi:hypothetical protein
MLIIQEDKPQLKYATFQNIFEFRPVYKYWTSYGNKHKIAFLRKTPRAQLP